MGLHVTGRLKVSTGVRLTGELVVEGDLDLRAADVKEVPEGARVTGNILTEREAGGLDDLYPIGRGQVFIQTRDGGLRVLDEVDEWCNLALDTQAIRARLTRPMRYQTTRRTEQSVTVTYEQVEFRRTPEPGIPRHLQGAPRYRQMEYRGGRRPLR